ncbi:MAG: hypothetical protein OXF86_17175 [Caldilineaceae bacterium]|nr:hypothetical protein [Caldilineaceae bacterium]
MWIQVGWKWVEDDRLSFSLAVPFPWLTFYLHSDAANPIAVLLSGERAVEILRDFLSTLEGRNLGIFAFERDSLQLFAFRQNSAEDFNEPELHSLLTGSHNGLHALQASIAAYLSSLEYQISLCLAVKALRAIETNLFPDNCNPRANCPGQAADHRECRCTAFT